MKQKYLIPFLFLGFFLTGTHLWGQTFSKKEDQLINRVRYTFDQKSTIDFSDIFNYPEGYNPKANLKDSSNVDITFTSTNENNIKFDSYYYSQWGGLYFKYLIPKGTYGKDTLTVAITYNGSTAKAHVITNIAPIVCKDDKYTVSMGDTTLFNVIKNDAPSKHFDKSTLEIIENATLGTTSITDNYEIEYISNENAPNYSVDSIIYRLADTDGNYDTAKVSIDIHKNSYASKVFSYLPGSGQFVNTTWANAEAAAKIIGNTFGGVSLGGFGGYIIAGFDQPIVNREKNPYGVDFTVVGNAFGGWGEPAAVQVMKDENGNGLPDDTWYELAGSEYYFSSTIKNLTMTYYNPKKNGRKTIPFSTDKGFNGAMRTNDFHKQPYYPDPFDFGNGIDSTSYTGTFTKFLLDKSQPNLIVAKRIPLFGYADAHPKNSTPTNPQNPYMNDENGKAADGFDLEWAVDANGNHVELDTVHFVKVYNTVQEDGGWLGEISPEVFAIAITTPDPSYVKKDYEAHSIGAAQLQVLKGEELQYEGILFKNGIPQTGTPSWTSSKPEVATIDNTGKLKALKNGETTIKFSMKADVPADSLVIEVVELTKILIELEGNASQQDTIKVRKGEIEYINVEAIDNRAGQRNRFVYETYNWTSSDENVGTISNGLFKAKNKGVTTLIAQSVHNPTLKDTIVAVVENIPEVVALKDTIDLQYYQKEGSFKNDQLFTTGDNDLVVINSLTLPDEITGEIENNVFNYSIAEDAFGYFTVKFNVEFNGTTKDIDIVFNVVTPNNLSTPKQLLFVNGGAFMMTNTQLMSYLINTNTTSKIDNKVGKATSVQDMLIDGNYAYVSADYYITRYNISKNTVTDSIYTQDLSAVDADGQGTDGAGVNHKMLIYQNLLLATRQSSSAAPQDGYNVRVYNKGDLSFIKKIPVSNQATDIVAIGDTAYVMINGGFAGSTSSMAVIDLKTLTLKREENLGTNGLGVMQMVAKGNKIYCLRLNDYMGRYNSGIVIYDTETHTVENIEYEANIPYDSSPLAIEPMTGDTLFVKKDLGYVAFNTATKSFSDNVVMTIPARLYQDSDHIGRGSTYDPDDKKYYIAYGYWHGEGAGQIYNQSLDSIGTFNGVGASPEVAKLCLASANNNKPYTKYGNKKTVKEEQNFSFYLKYNTFEDKEDGRPTIYLYNPAQYNWITYDPASRKLTGKFDGEVLEPTTFDILIQGIDKQGAFAMDTVKLTVTPVDDAPYLANPISDIIVKENSRDYMINLTNVFADKDDKVIIKSVKSNSNEALISTNISNDRLTLSFTKNNYGEATIVVEASSNGKTVEDTFSVEVFKDKLPYIVNPIADITVKENAEDKVIDLSNVFDDDDDVTNAIVKSVKSNSNEALISTSLLGNDLTLSFAANSYGEAEIVIEALSNEKTITDTFMVTVLEDKAPVVANPIEDVTVRDNFEDKIIDLSNVFTDEDDNDNVIFKFVKSNSNNALVNANIDNNTLTLSFVANNYGEATIVIGASSNGKTVTDTFMVNVLDNKLPVVANPIEDISLPVMHENSTIINIADVFTDPDDDDENITKEIVSNSNTAFVNAYIEGNNLVVEYLTVGEGEAEIVVKATSNGDTIEDTFTVKVETIDYTKGTFVVNEDWFGNDLGSVNFVRDNGEVIYRAYRRENKGEKLGVTTQFATVYGNKVYFVSKQAPRLVVADAKTLQKVVAIDEIGTADGRAFIGVNSTLGYISTSNGIYTYSITNNKVGTMIENTNGETGNMLLANGYVFAVQKDKILVLQNNKVVSTIEGDTYAGLTRSVDGMVWVGAKNKLIKINPYTLANEKVDLPENANTFDWGWAWNANSLCASTTENALFWGKAPVGWSGSNTIYKYVIGDKTSLDAPFATLSGDWTLYGAGLRVNPENNKVYVTAKKDGWGANSLKNQVTIFDGSNGEVKDNINLREYYWFPAMPMFTDRYAPTTTLASAITVKENAEDKVINLSDFITDKDNLDKGIVTFISSISNESILSANINNDTLTIDFIENQHGASDIELEINSNGKIIKHIINVMINEDKAPIVANPIEDVIIRENAVDTLISLENVFTDPDDNDNAIVKSIVSNSNDKVVSVSISDNQLTIATVKDATGEATIVIEASSNGKTIQETFKITVKEYTGIDDLTSGDILIYPNPTDGKFKVEMNAHEKSTVKVYDIKGRLIYVNENYFSENWIDISNQPSGQYIVTIINDKIIKHSESIIKK